MSNPWVKKKVVAESGATEDQGGGGSSLPFYARTRIFIEPEFTSGFEEVGFETIVVKTLRRLEHLRGSKTKVKFAKELVGFDAIVKIRPVKAKKKK